MADPMHQFQIATLIPFHIGGVDLSFTNSSLWMLIGAVLSIVGLTIASERKAMIPGRLQAGAESLYNFIDHLITENLGAGAKLYFPVVLS